MLENLLIFLGTVFFSGGCVVLITAVIAGYMSDGKFEYTTKKIRTVWIVSGIIIYFLI